MKFAITLLSLPDVPPPVALYRISISTSNDEGLLWDPLTMSWLLSLATWIFFGGVISAESD